MPSILLTRGIQGSGKSHWAKDWVQYDPENRVRVNRDDLRRMLYGTTGTLLDWKQEEHVTLVERSIARTALEAGRDVIVDAMNLRGKYVRAWFALGYPVRFRDFTVALDLALERNAEREHPVPEEAIRRAYERFTVKGELLPVPVQDKPATGRYVPDLALPTAVIVDIDGTLAHIVTGRSPYDWDRVGEDAVDEAVKELVGNLCLFHRIILVSGRQDVCRDETVWWLLRHAVNYDALHMRAAGDGRSDVVVKREIFDRHIRDQFNVRLVVDDRNQVVRAWRDMGIKCLQAEEGAF